jgi:hypothetical protein
LLSVIAHCENLAAVIFTTRLARPPIEEHKLMVGAKDARETIGSRVVAKPVAAGLLKGLALPASRTELQFLFLQHAQGELQRA